MHEINSFCTVKTAKSISSIMILLLLFVTVKYLLSFCCKHLLSSITFRLLSNQPVKEALLALFLSPQILRKYYCPPQWCCGEPKRIR